MSITFFVLRKRTSSKKSEKNNLARLCSFLKYGGEEKEGEAGKECFLPFYFSLHLKRE